MRSQYSGTGFGSRGLVGGFVILVVGTVFLLVNLGVLHAPFVRIWWPVLLIVLGTIKLVHWLWSRHPGRPYRDFV
jgi:hypothetical protein